MQRLAVAAVRTPDQRRPLGPQVADVEPAEDAVQEVGRLGVEGDVAAVGGDRGAVGVLVRRRRLWRRRPGDEPDRAAGAVEDEDVAHREGVAGQRGGAVAVFVAEVRVLRGEGEVAPAARERGRAHFEAALLLAGGEGDVDGGEGAADLAQEDAGAGFAGAAGAGGVADGADGADVGDEAAVGRDRRVGVFGRAAGRARVVGLGDQQGVAGGAERGGGKREREGRDRRQGQGRELPPHRGRGPQAGAPTWLP